MARQPHGMTVKDLYGGRFIKPELVKQSMSGLEDRLTTEFKERVKHRDAMNDHMRKLRAPITALIEKDAHARSAVSGLRDLAAAASNAKKKHGTVHRPKAVERVFLEQSYHVATLDYDQNEIEERAVAFAAKVVSG